MRAQETAVRLEDIPSCFEGIIPAAISTVAPDGTPNVTYISVVQRIDSDHVALSRQFFKKTDDNTRVNPYAQVCLLEPETGRLFLLDLVYERTETEGPLFERMRTKLDAVAAHEGLENVFKLRGTDICRVEACTMLPSVAAAGPPRRDVKIERVEEFSRHIADVEDMDELLSTMLRACAELLGYDHVFVMLVDETGKRLYTVASAGFPSSGAGSEVRIGEGMIGLAAERHQSVRVTHMGREISYSQATRKSAGQEADGVEQAIALPQLQSVQSQMVSPMLAYRKLVGVLCLQSEVPGAFQAADESVAGILANQVAMAMATLRKTEREAPEAAPDEASGTIEIKHYQEDDSVFLDNEYLIKGVAGGILWRLLRNFQDHGRVEFSNREIRLDQTLDLPDIKDNLEARLILLRKRLEERCDYLRIEKSARGRFRLRVERPLALVQVAGGGPLTATPADAGDPTKTPNGNTDQALPSGTAVILFTDIVGSTELTERLGDTAFRERARQLDVTLRRLIREGSGVPVEGKLLGDGVLAVFTSARQAIDAALQCAVAGDSAGLPLHLGLHAGDVIRERDNVYGGAVNIASRVSSLSAAGELLVSDIVRGLARTSSEVTFEDRGEQSLRGVGEPIRIWKVNASGRA
jgi:class 3 adenylate cyclase/putative methionine-R-sulfoxide reductase with GAF domain